MLITKDYSLLDLEFTFETIQSLISFSRDTDQASCWDGAKIAIPMFDTGLHSRSRSTIREMSNVEPEIGPVLEHLDTVDLTSGHMQEKEEPNACDHQTPDVHVASLPPTPTAQRYKTTELETESVTNISPSPSPRNPATSLRRVSSDGILGHYANDSGSDDELALGRVAQASSYIADAGNPNSYKEAVNSPQWEHWKTAIREELDKMEKYQVFKVIPR